MTKLSARLSEAVAFDPGLTLKDIKVLSCTQDKSDAQIALGCARRENDRIQPIMKAVGLCLDALANSQDWIRRHHELPEYSELILNNDAALSALDSVIGGRGE